MGQEELMNKIAELEREIAIFLKEVFQRRE